MINNLHKSITMNTLPKALVSYLQSFLRPHNPTYEPNQSIESTFKNGSRNRFCTDCHVNGEYFRSKNNNEYFWIAERKSTVSDVLSRHDWIPSSKVKRILYWYDPSKHVFLRLEIKKNKQYFVA